jgi:signal transduction histidine kinase
LETGEAILYPELGDYELAANTTTSEQLVAARALGVRSGMFVPLLARGRTLGAICFFAAGSRRLFGSADLARVTELSRRAALALDNAQLYRQATEAIRLRDTVLSSVSHDLRNPLTAIRVIAETLKLQLAQEPIREIAALQEGLERIAGNTQRMAAQIDELLDVARLQTGAPLKLTPSPTDLVALARELIGEYQARTGRHRIRFEPAVSSVLGRWDRARLERVVGNLLANAIKYSLLEVLSSKLSWCMWAIPNLRCTYPVAGDIARRKRMVTPSPTLASSCIRATYVQPDPGTFRKISGVANQRSGPVRLVPTSSPYTQGGDKGCLT